MDGSRRLTKVGVHYRPSSFQSQGWKINVTLRLLLPSSGSRRITRVTPARRQQSQPLHCLGLWPNVGGPRYTPRKLLLAIAEASLLYAAPIWTIATSRGSYLKGARSVLRSMALRLIRGFCTISKARC